jgi:16S rRNA (guanine527-N7)-methyltransferase
VPINKDLLRRGLAALALPDEGPLADGLARYLSEIELWNPAYGLVKADSDELVVKHALDSLAPLPLIVALLGGIASGRTAAAKGPGEASLLPPLRLRLADIGSGAGLPGIPLALALGDVEVTLVDRMGRRIRFLENQKALLGLSNVRILESEVERVEGRFDLVTFRAFRPFERRLFSKVFALCETDGALVAWKGRIDRAKAELAAIEGLFSRADVVPLRVPFMEEERCAVVLRPA